jgi:hypothetical protein
MPLPLPTLDDRRWADLVEEGRALIPRYAPEWSDHNIHDPGITLIELFAWLAEAAVYRLNRIPPRHLRKFLALAGIRATGPEAAYAVLTFGPFAAGPPFLLPAGVEFDVARHDGQTVKFATQRAVTLARITLSALSVDAGDGVIRDFSGQLRDGFPCELFGPAAGKGAAVYLGFDDLPTGAPVTLAFWFAGPGNDLVERRRIEAEAKAQHEACQPITPDFDCAPTPPAIPLESPPQHHSARLIWQFSTGPSNWDTLHRVSMPNQPATGEAVDDTRSLTLDGIVQWNFPPTLAKVAIAGEPTPRFYVRCMLDKGAWDAPVVLRALRANAVTAWQAVPLWQTFAIRAGLAPGGIPPPPGEPAAINFTLDDSGVVQTLSFAASGGPSFLLFAYTAPGPTTPGSITVGLSVVGVGTGEPNQTLSVLNAPLDLASMRTLTHDGAAWTEWARKDDFDASFGASHHVVVDPTAGTISFGDGDHGRVPSPDHLIVVGALHTSAEHGNRAPLSAVRLPGGPINAALLAALSTLQLLQVRQTVAIPFGASGAVPSRSLGEMIGEAVETLDAHETLTTLAETFGRNTLDQIPRAAVLSARVPTSAVDLLDIERIALDTPGARIARAHAWRDLDPAFPCLRAGGTVTVLIIPDMPTSNPAPSAGLLEAVRRYLHRRRIICTRLRIIGPRYVSVTVHASVRTAAGADPTRVAGAVRAAIDAFLDPRAGGPDGFGWPFGRSVYRTEILQLIDGVPGVDHVRRLTLRAGTGSPQCGDLRLCATSLPAAGEHTIEVS